MPARDVRVTRARVRPGPGSALLALLLLLLPACSRLPSAPVSHGVGSGGVRAAEAVNGYAPGQVVVRVQPGTSEQALADAYGSAVLASVPELRLSLLRPPTGITELALVERLQSDPRVEFAELNYQARTAESRQSTIAFSEGFNSWSDVLDQDAFARVHAAAAHSVTTGARVLVGVLDTGIDLDHPALEDQLDLPGIEPGVVTSPGDDRAEQVDTNQDGLVDGALGHGTHVAGIVHAIAPEARLLPVRVLDSDGVGYAFAVARGLVETVGRGAQIANLSLGMPVPSLAVEAAVDYARAAGVVIVGPAGNSDLAQVEFPASLPAVVAIAGTDPLDHKATFSNYGAAVDATAPSTAILSTYVGGGYATWSGTSMAAPFASGIAALLYSELGARSATTATRVEALLRQGAVPLASVDPVYGAALGAGRVDAAASVDAVAAGGSAAASGREHTTVAQ